MVRKERLDLDNFKIITYPNCYLNKIPFVIVTNGKIELEVDLFSFRITHHYMGNIDEMFQLYQEFSEWCCRDENSKLLILWWLENNEKNFYYQFLIKKFSYETI